MRVLVVCSGTTGTISPFINEQMDSLNKQGEIELSLFQIKKKGHWGYLLHLFPLLKEIKHFKPDLVHAHYGLSGFLANLQRGVPVLTTFHGSDVNNYKILKWSKWTHRLSAASVFVEKNMMGKFKKHHNSFIIPCGVDISNFYPVPKSESQGIVNLRRENINILFSSEFNNPVKNYPLARISCNIVEKKIGRKVNLIELKGYDRISVNLFMNAVDCVLLHSISEGSPQFIKEAMACNCPIVATNVGDVAWILGETRGCFITSPEVEDVANNVIMAMQYAELFSRTNGRERILTLGLDTGSISKRLSEVYNIVIK